MDRLDSSPAGARVTRRTPAACTIIARNYLSHARILADSYRRHEPDGRFYLLVVDGLPDGVSVGINIHIIDPRELNIPYFFEMCFKYDVVELCTAVKPSFMSIIMERYQEDSLIYFDPDILIMRPLSELKAELDCGDIILTPHILDPIPLDQRLPAEQEFLGTGTFNLGFIAVKNSKIAINCLRWWEERLRDACRRDSCAALFYDQKWMNLAPVLFPSTRILFDPTYNVAYWNLHSRLLERHGETFFVGGRPLAFFHFSGFDPKKRLQLAWYQTRIQVLKGTPLAELLGLYADLQEANGYEVSSKWEYGYAKFSDGRPVDRLLAQLYLSLDEGTREKFGNPFKVDGSNSFLGWAITPQAEDGNLSPLLMLAYLSREDVAGAFPDVRGVHREAYLDWLRTEGQLEMGYDPELVRLGSATPITGFIHRCSSGAGNQPHACPVDERMNAQGDHTLHMGVTGNVEGDRDQVIAELKARIDAIQATRVWQLGSLYWRTRDRIRKALGRAPKLVI